MFECDERQISQVLTNLIKNAAESIESKASEEKGQISVSIERDGEHVILAVMDNGVGFPEGKEGAMLEPYVTTRPQGTGLGLAIVKKIVEDHKGLLKLENNSDCGAKVTLYF
jgi:two-component system nitrogen regulation sensor histidine kinase NtrY